MSARSEDAGLFTTLTWSAGGLLAGLFTLFTQSFVILVPSGTLFGPGMLVALFYFLTHPLIPFIGAFVGALAGLTRHTLRRRLSMLLSNAAASVVLVLGHLAIIRVTGGLNMPGDVVPWWIFVTAIVGLVPHVLLASWVANKVEVRLRERGAPPPLMG